MTATLPYATGRRYLDADSHLMELPGWLVEFADPAIRDRIRPLRLGGAGKLANDAVERAEQRRGDEAAAHTLEERLMTAKGWHALGAFDPAERSRALDLLGFDAQLVFSTFAATQFAGDDLELLYGGTAHTTVPWPRSAPTTRASFPSPMRPGTILTRCSRPWSTRSRSAPRPCTFRRAAAARQGTVAP